MTTYLEELSRKDPKTCVLDSPESVVSFWFGSVNHTDIQSLAHIESMMGVWFGGKSPQFDQIQRENVALVDRVAAATAAAAEEEEGEGEGREGQLGEEWSTPIGGS